eukprot:4388139-Alexandrium_andersonii.AAC.1
MRHGPRLPGRCPLSSGRGLAVASRATLPADARAAGIWSTGCARTAAPSSASPLMRHGLWLPGRCPLSSGR